MTPPHAQNKPPLLINFARNLQRDAADLEEQLENANLGPPNFLEKSMRLALGPCYLSAAINLGLKALYGPADYRPSITDSDSLALYENLDQPTRNQLEAHMRATGSCVVDKWSLTAQETVEPMRVYFKVEEDCPALWGYGDNTRTRLDWHLEYRHRIWNAINDTYDEKWGSFN